VEVPREVGPYADQVVAVTDAVCREHFDEEYADLCRALVGRLGRKRPSPLTRGDLRIWAAGSATRSGSSTSCPTPSRHRTLTWARQFSQRLWAIEGCNGIGWHVADRLGDGEQVVDVPPKLSARMRVRITGLHPVGNDVQRAQLRVLVDRRRELGDDHVRMTCQLHALLLELIPGGAKKDLSAAGSPPSSSATWSGSTAGRRPPTGKRVTSPTSTSSLAARRLTQRRASMEVLPSFFFRSK
jgi:hypothetical protein